MNDDLSARQAVRNACIEAALAAYEDAGIAGLCAEGRWEAAISAMQSLDLGQIAAAPCAVDPRSGSNAAGGQLAASSSSSA